MVCLVAILNFAYFGVEFAVALRIGSVSLFADSVDFLEDASINLLIFAALGWSARNRARTVTAYVWHTAWPDLIVGLLIFLINLDAAKEIYEAAREEHRAAML